MTALTLTIVYLAVLALVTVTRGDAATLATLRDREKQQRRTIRHDRDVLRFFGNHPHLARTGRHVIRFARSELRWTLRELRETVAQMQPRSPWPAWWERQAACIRSHEGAWTSNTGNGYYGAYQFLLGTWQAVGGHGYPHLASPTEQTYRAWLLWNRSGHSWSQWGTAGMCGLR